MSLTKIILQGNYSDNIVTMMNNCKAITNYSKKNNWIRSIYCPLDNELIQIVIVEQDKDVNPVVVVNQFGMAIDKNNNTGLVLISQNVTSYFPKNIFDIVFNNLNTEN